jgi:hypothetical protein
VNGTSIHRVIPKTVSYHMAAFSTSRTINVVRLMMLVIDFSYTFRRRNFNDAVL